MAVFLGIDPGLQTVGFGVVQGDGDAMRLLGCGAIITSSSLPTHQRLMVIKEDMESLLKEFKPDAVGVEDLFFGKNVTNAIKVAHARGVILESIGRAGIPLFEFTPAEVKNNVCGYGQADKIQMQEMIRRLLKLDTAPKPDDAADALGIAICASRVFKS